MRIDTDTGCLALANKYYYYHKNNKLRAAHDMTAGVSFIWEPNLFTAGVSKFFFLKEISYITCDHQCQPS